MSLLELMLALGLGLFLIAGVVNAFLSNKDTIRVETSLARLQENGRMALDLIAKDVRDAMYLGCGSGGSGPEVMARHVSYRGVAGFERTASAWSPPLPASLASLDDSGAIDNRVGSDVLRLQHAGAIGAGLNPSAAVLPAAAAVSIASNPTCLEAGDRVVIAGCRGSHLFEITNDPACGGSATTLEYAASANAVTRIAPGYSTGDDILAFFDKTWFVADTGRRRTGREIPVYSLYRRTNGASEEMVEGVEYLQVQYGQLLDTGNMRYVSAGDAGLDWSEVAALRIALLLRSYEPVLDAADTGTYRLLDQSIGAAGTAYTHDGDRGLRRVFSTTVALRNGMR